MLVRNIQSLRFWKLLVIVILLELSVNSIYFKGYLWGKSNVKSKINSQGLKQEEEVYLQLFQRVYKLIKEKYVEEISVKKMIYGAIDGMLASLEDEYSVFLKPSEYASFKRNTQGNYTGIGVYISYENKKSK